MPKNKRHILFQSYGLVDSDPKNWEEGYKDFLEMNELSEDDCCLDTYIADECDNWYDCEEANLNKPTEGKIIAIADLGFWNGRTMGYKVLGNNVNDCLYWSGDCREIEIYADGRDIRSTQYHHDNHHNILYRELKPMSEQTEEKFLDKIYNGTVTSKDITKYTRSILPYVKEVYGW